MRHATITTVFCKRVVYGIKFEGGTACRKSRNLGFWLSFWVLLGQRPKVPRGRSHETYLRTGARNTPALLRSRDLPVRGQHRHAYLIQRALHRGAGSGMVSAAA